MSRMIIQKLVLATLLLICVSGCNTLKPTDSPAAQVSADPYQGLNRRIYRFNAVTDKAIIKPVAKGYKAVTPKVVRARVSSFFQNLAEPLYAVNNLLQAKVDRTLISTYRFIVNSTIGIGGLFDVVDYAYGVKPAREDFGQTLAAWGAGPGPYVVLPFFGPSNLRDSVGLLTETLTYFPNDIITDSSNVSTGLTILQIVDTRSQFLGVDGLVGEQLDPYQFVKIASEKNRLNALYDGAPPNNAQEDFDDF